VGSTGVRGRPINDSLRTGAQVEFESLAHHQKERPPRRAAFVFLRSGVRSLDRRAGNDDHVESFRRDDVDVEKTGESADAGAEIGVSGHEDLGGAERADSGGHARETVVRCDHGE